MSDEFNNNYDQQPQVPPPAPEDNPNIGIKLGSCCIPLLGLILFLVWKDEKPVSAKAAGKFALIGVGVGVACWILYFILIVALGVGSAMMY